jgi:KaiC/GvpD/RAD55 family RecA-like ATPase
MEKKMERLKTNKVWLDKLLPEGFPVNSSTVITGPGGSGKPLIGESFVSAWLSAGGSVIFLSLQYPDKTFITESLKTITGIDVEGYSNQIIFIHLDVTITNYKKVSSNEYRANLVIPEVWDEVLSEAETNLSPKEHGILIFGSALNLLLFSPTYGDKILEKMINSVTTDKTKTYILSVSTSAKAEEIAKLENAADNLIMTRSEKPPFKLYMQILRMKGVPFISDEIEVPIDDKSLKQIKKVADHSRNKVIPAISAL